MFSIELGYDEDRTKKLFNMNFVESNYFIKNITNCDYIYTNGGKNDCDDITLSDLVSVYEYFDNAVRLERLAKEKCGCTIYVDEYNFNVRDIIDNTISSTSLNVSDFIDLLNEYSIDFLTNYEIVNAGYTSILLVGGSTYEDEEYVRNLFEDELQVVKIVVDGEIFLSPSMHENYDNYDKEMFISEILRNFKHLPNKEKFEQDLYKYIPEFIDEWTFLEVVA